MFVSFHEQKFSIFNQREQRERVARPPCAGPSARGLVAPAEQSRCVSGGPWTPSTLGVPFVLPTPSLPVAAPCVKSSAVLTMKPEGPGFDTPDPCPLKSLWHEARTDCSLSPRAEATSSAWSQAPRLKLGRFSVKDPLIFPGLPLNLARIII